MFNFKIPIGLKNCILIIFYAIILSVLSGCLCNKSRKSAIYKETEELIIGGFSISDYVFEVKQIKVFNTQTNSIIKEYNDTILVNLCNFCNDCLEDEIDFEGRLRR